METSDSPSSEVATKAIDIIGVITNKLENGNSELEDNGDREALDNDQMRIEYKHFPVLELTLNIP